MVVIRTGMCMTKIQPKRNGNHSYRNMHDDNPFKNKMVVIRTEMCMTTIHSKTYGSHSYRNVHDDKPFKKIL